jgi:hypothetical protein
MAFWVSGSAARKMTSNTRRTSMSGVIFISARGRGISARTTVFAPTRV